MSTCEERLLQEPYPPLVAPSKVDKCHHLQNQKPSGSSKVASSSSPRRRSFPCCDPRISTDPARSLPEPGNLWNIVPLSWYHDTHPIQHGWEVKSAHLVPGESPERLFVGVQVAVVSAVPETDNFKLHSAQLSPPKGAKQCTYMLPLKLPSQTSYPASARRKPKALARSPITQSAEEQRSPCWREINIAQFLWKMKNWCNTA